MRFTLRDMLWLTVVVGLVAAWSLDHYRLANRAETFRLLVGRALQAPWTIELPAKTSGPDNRP